MKLTAKPISYSSIVGGGLMLLDAEGRAAFMVMLRGTTRGISKEQNDAIAEQLVRLINADGLGVPDV